MPSPDIKPYIDLTVYDLQPTDIYDAAIQYAATSLPEWQPIPGSTEDALLQAASEMTGQLIGAINRLPAGVVEALLKLYGVERITGIAPTGEVEFTLTHFNGATIPSGVRLGYSDRTGDEPILYTFETTATVTAPIGANTVTVGIVGLSSSRYPLLSEGEPLQLLSALSYVDSVALTEDLEPGQNPEDGAEYIARANAVFGRLSESLTLASQIDNYLLSTYPAVYRAKAHSRLRGFRPATSLVRASNIVTATFSDPVPLVAGERVRVTDADVDFTGTFIVGAVDGATVYWSQTGANASATLPGTVHSFRFQDDNYNIESEEYEPQNGFVTIYTSAVGGASVGEGLLATATDDLRNRTVAGLILNIDHAHITPVTVNIFVTKDKVSPSSVVQGAVQQAVAGYIHPDHWPWEAAIYQNEIIGLIDRIPGVDRVVSVTLEGDEDVALVNEETGDLGFRYAGVLPLATINVTIET